MRRLIQTIGIMCLNFYVVISLHAELIELNKFNELSKEGIKKRMINITNILSDAIFVNNLTALTWNTAYNPEFFGLGINVATTMSNSHYLNKINSLDSDILLLDTKKLPGFSLVSGLHVRVPIPLVNLPFDIGFYISSIDFSDLNSKSLKFDNLFSIGFDTRWNFLGKEKNQGLIAGFAYFYQSFGIKYPFPDFNTQNEKDELVSIGGDYTTKLGFDFHTFGLKGQYSHLFLGTIELTVGLEPYFGITNLRVSSSGDIELKCNNKSYFITKYINECGEIKTNFFSGPKISFSQDIIRKGLRFYGGFSLKLFVLFLDLGISYEPFHNSVGGLVGTRLVF